MRTSPSTLLFALGLSLFSCGEEQADTRNDALDTTPSATDTGSGSPTQPSPSATNPDPAPPASTPVATGPATVAPPTPSSAPSPSTVAPSDPTATNTAPPAPSSSPTPENTAPSGSTPSGSGGADNAPAPSGSNAGGAGGESSSGGQAGRATGAGGSGGSDGDSGFNPCPAAPEPCKVLPLGDSITEGMLQQGGSYVFEGGYRVELFKLAREAGKSLTFVGTRSNGPDTVAGEPFPKNNEGYSGITIQGLHNQHIPGKLAPGPHIILLHLGTNDMISSANGAPARLGALIDDIIEELPDSLLVVSTLIPLGIGNAAVQTYNAALPALVEERAASGAHIVLVDQFTGFPNSELPDSVHPNVAGYARMAGVWYEAIAPYLR